MEPDSLRLPVVVSAVVCYYSDAVIFKENYNAAYNNKKHGLLVVKRTKLHEQVHELKCKCSAVEAIFADAIV